MRLNTFCCVRLNSTSALKVGVTASYDRRLLTVFKSDLDDISHGKDRDQCPQPRTLASARHEHETDRGGYQAL